jgi:Ca2+-binding EF-hand superfamily protein
MKVILEKIQDQWKTIRKSFHDISKDTRGQMEAEELKFYLNHWGIHVTDETFNKIFQTLDWDKDGKVSYTDFHTYISKRQWGERFTREKVSTFVRINPPC